MVVVVLDVFMFGVVVVLGVVICDGEMVVPENQQILLVVVIDCTKLSLVE